MKIFRAFVDPRAQVHLRIRRSRKAIPAIPTIRHLAGPRASMEQESCVCSGRTACWYGPGQSYVGPFLSGYNFAVLSRALRTSQSDYIDVSVHSLLPAENQNIPMKSHPVDAAPQDVDLVMVSCDSQSIRCFLSNLIVAAWWRHGGGWWHGGGRWRHSGGMVTASWRRAHKGAGVQGPSVGPPRASKGLQSHLGASKRCQGG